MSIAQSVAEGILKKESTVSRSHVHDSNNCHTTIGMHAHIYT